ncbi:uncharacterized protein LOC132753204 [Ruditapes philippinarum]|uniref:uncharacterized protein LOC132753204 n=1 Tax=Ruditapes philippinarum TaxID=129788 RepID=UPI00295A90E2|nr:uncharacterized protein LOC132753204 [Ruditapes philippinarum]XP_060599628.1 uncharacterized protein LOC132753204 [Ruditapes philippinarum]
MGKKKRKQFFFDEDTPHGLIKRVMLKKYLQAYIAKTQAYNAKTQDELFNLKTVYIDAFAGEGRYGSNWPTEIEKYGSPLIALMVVLELYYNRDMKKQGGKNKDEPEVTNTFGTEVLEDQETGYSEAAEILGYVSQEKSDIEQGGIWGWTTSQVEAEEELATKLETRSQRRDILNKSANITLQLIEKDTAKYMKLAENVELLIMKFLERHYPEYEYGFSQEEKSTLFDINTGYFSVRVEVYNQAFADTSAPQMLRDPSVRSLTFLDPFGFKDTPMAHVQQFAPGPGNEILINFMSSFVNRFVSKSHEHVLQLYGIPLEVAKYYGIDQSDGEENEDKLVEFVKRVIHFSQPQKECEFSNNINKCARNYEAFLKKKINCKYSSLFELKDKQNTTLFHMVHVTNHVRGIEAMKESMNRCSQKEGEMVMSDYDVFCKGQNLNFVNMDDNEKVAEMIYSQFRGKERVPISDINDYVLLDTNYVFRKRPLNILQRSGKITTAVDNLKRPQKSKGRFPDRDIETKQELTWYISFADEEFRSESVDGPDVKKQKLVKDVKEKKEKKERKKGNKKGRRSSTRADEREETSMSEKSKGHRKRRGSKNVNNKKAKKRKKLSHVELGDNHVNVNNNGASSSLVGELAKDANGHIFVPPTHEQTNERQEEKENSVRKLRQCTLTETLQIVKGEKETYTEKSSKQQDKKKRKRKLSPSYGTLDRFLKS